MPIPIKKASAAESLAVISNVALGAFVMCALYFGRDVLVPVALAALLTFLLAPLVTRLQRWLGRVAPVLVVVAMIFALTGTLGWVLMQQTVDLANKLPSYKENIRTRLRSIQLPNEGPFSKASRTIEELKEELPGSNNQDARSGTSGNGKAEKEEMPVRIVNDKDERIEFVQLFVAPILGPLGTAGLVMLLLVFMLLERDDLRIRIVRLLGQGRICVTTTAMDEVGLRVSRYLAMQLVINVTYGIPVAIGLYFIGVPNAMLWGALATVLRFIPYVGPWIAATFPILLSFAVSTSWLPPILTISLFVLLELFSNNVMEPLLYGSSTGVRPIALIVAALAWTWLWGPVGLVLATPLTVCLMVMGRIVPRLAFLHILLSDDEPLTPAEDCYHRLHSVGEFDEMDLVNTFLITHPPSELFDTMLIPVIAFAESDFRLGLLDEEHLVSIEQGLHRILEDLDMRWEASLPLSANEGGSEFRVCCIPARAYRDELASEMICQLIIQHGHQSHVSSAKMVPDRMIGWVREMNAGVACISAVPPTTVIQARYLCMKLRKNFPDLRIVIGLWGMTENFTDSAKALVESGADDVVNTVGEAIERILRHAPKVGIAALEESHANHDSHEA
jgi:predicted PurR-regulated permease PerM